MDSLPNALRGLAQLILLPLALVGILALAPLLAAAYYLRVLGEGLLAFGRALWGRQASVPKDGPESAATDIVIGPPPSL